MAIMQILFYFFKYKNSYINYKLLKFRLLIRRYRKIKGDRRRYRKIKGDRGYHSVCNYHAKLLSSNSLYLLLTPSIYRASEACEISVNRTILLHTQAAHSEVPCQW